MKAALNLGIAVARPDGPQSRRWRDPGEGRRRRRPRSDRAGRKAACRADRDWRSGRGGARRDPLCDARTLLAFRRVAALRRRRSSRPASPASSRRWRTPIRWWAARGTRGCRAAGIAVSVGAGAEQARRDHLGHILRVTAGRPAVTLKLAETADGFASAGSNDARLRITGPIADLRVQIMRSTHEAIMIGIETALADDPALTVRLPGLDRKPLRVVLDTHLRLPERSRLAATARDSRPWSLRAQGRPTRPPSACRTSASMIERVPLDEDGPCDLEQALASAQRPRHHPRLQRRRAPGRGPADRAWARRRGRPHHGRQAARPARRRRAG